MVEEAAAEEQERKEFENENETELIDERQNEEAGWKPTGSEEETPNHNDGNKAVALEAENDDEVAQETCEQVHGQSTEQQQQHSFEGNSLLESHDDRAIKEQSNAILDLVNLRNSNTSATETTGGNEDDDDDEIRVSQSQSIARAESATLRQLPKKSALAVQSSAVVRQSASFAQRKARQSSLTLLNSSDPPGAYSITSRRNEGGEDLEEFYDEGIDPPELQTVIERRFSGADATNPTSSSDSSATRVRMLEDDPETGQPRSLSDERYGGTGSRMTELREHSLAGHTIATSVLATALDDENVHDAVPIEEAQAFEAKGTKRAFHSRWVLLLALLLVVVAVVVLVVAMTTTTQGTTVMTTEGEQEEGQTSLGPTPTDFPTSSPTLSFQARELMDFLVGISSDDGVSLTNTTSPQYNAFQWLLADPRIGERPSPEIGFRFALSTLYLSTYGERWISSRNWLSLRNHCDWEFVRCSQRNDVRQLDPKNNNLQGTIPREILLLSNRLSKSSEGRLPFVNLVSKTCFVVLPQQIWM